MNSELEYIYIYIILRQKSVKFNYFSNLPICRRSANSLNRRKLLICRAIPQSFDLHNITKVENQTKTVANKLVTMKTKGKEHKYDIFVKKRER